VLIKFDNNFMKVYFKSRKLQKICSEQKHGEKTLGSSCAKKLRQRMIELDAADSLADISRLPPRCHALTGDRKGTFSVDLLQPYRLIFAPADEPLPLNEQGGLDLKRVCEVLIIEIADTH